MSLLFSVGLLALGAPLVGAALPNGLRVNRALRATHSRRAVNRLIGEGRVIVNGRVVTSPESRLVAGDKVELDGQTVSWEESKLAPHRYVKFHKPANVVSTSNPKVPKNIISALEIEGFDNSERRVYTIGRLDEDSTGLILLTSNGDIVNPLLRSHDGKQKEYEVTTSPRASDDELARLREGVMITTLAKRNGEIVPVTAPTEPCTVERASVHAPNDHMLRFVLKEGRNRQIRRMCAALGLEVTKLHRVNFAGVTLRGIEREGSWAPLSVEEELLIGARVPPTRDELRTPEERAARKLKKKRKKDTFR